MAKNCRNPHLKQPRHFAGTERRRRRLNKALETDRLERLCRFYDVSIGSLFDEELVRMPTSIDIDRLKATVHLVQSVIHQRKVKPSPDKVAEIVSTVFTNEVRWLIDNPDSDTAFDPGRHRGFVEMVLKK